MRRSGGRQPVRRGIRRRGAGVDRIGGGSGSGGGRIAACVLRPPPGRDLGGVRARASIDARAARRGGGGLVGRRRGQEEEEEDLLRRQTRAKYKRDFGVWTAEIGRAHV